MLTLTGQYPNIYTEKFRVFYSDWQPSTSKFGQTTLTTIPKGWQVINTMIKCNTAFTGGAFTANVIRVFQSEFVAAAGVQTGQFAGTNVIQGVVKNYGVLAATTTRTRSTAPTTQNIICNFNEPTTLVATIDLTGTGNINSLTGGAVDIWLTRMRFT